MARVDREVPGHIVRVLDHLVVHRQHLQQLVLFDPVLQLGERGRVLERRREDEQAPGAQAAAEGAQQAVRIAGRIEDIDRQDRVERAVVEGGLVRRCHEERRSRSGGDRHRQLARAADVVEGQVDTDRQVDVTGEQAGESAGGATRIQAAPDLARLRCWAVGCQALLQKRGQALGERRQEGVRRRRIGGVVGAEDSSAALFGVRVVERQIQELVSPGR